MQKIMKQTICYSRLALLLLLSGHPNLLKAATSAAVATAAPSAAIATTNSDYKNAPEVVNINQASAEDLARKLKGIGSKRAQAIVLYREAHGPFIALEQLADVPGISSGMLDKNRHRIIL